MKYTLSPVARSDLREIWQYIIDGGGSAAVAERQIRSIEKTLRLLAMNPSFLRERTLHHFLSDQANDVGDCRRGAGKPGNRTTV